LNGANINAQNNEGYTPLCEATARLSPKIKKTESINNLLTEGADPNIANNNGETPLHVAAIKGTVSVIRLLLAAGADPSRIDKQGKTPKEEAIYWDYHEAAACFGK